VTEGHSACVFICSVTTGVHTLGAVVCVCGGGVVSVCGVWVCVPGGFILGVRGLGQQQHLFLWVHLPLRQFWLALGASSRSERFLLQC
jgi:hypothetical protein